MHFYLPYPGLDDRPLQEAVARCYERMIPHLAGPVRLSPEPVRETSTNRLPVKLFAEHSRTGCCWKASSSSCPEIDLSSWSYRWPRPGETRPRNY